LELLEGKNVKLRIVEKEDISLVVEWINNPEFYGSYNPLQQTSKTELEKRFENLPPEEKTFFIEKKDGSKVGGISHSLVGNQWEIGYTLIPTERRKGYCTEAVEIMVDYLFLSKEIGRIQAHTDARNEGSQKVLEHAGFRREGTIRRSSFVRGEWRDMFLYSILREEWKEPRVLTKAA
jgi:RimJ/RimL family protein N-acetyltransferase